MKRPTLGDNPFDDAPAPAGGDPASPDADGDADASPDEGANAARIAAAAPPPAASGKAKPRKDAKDASDAKPTKPAKASEATAAAKDAAAKQPAREAATKDAAATQPSKEAAKPAKADAPTTRVTPPAQPRAERAPIAETVAAPRGAWPDRSPRTATEDDWAGAVEDVPDAAYSDGFSDADDDVFLGEEAVVPPGEYAPSIPSFSGGNTTELRELERRISAHSTPAFPLEQIRRLPLQFLWKRWRVLAMRGRSDVVDDFGRDPLYTARFEPFLDFLYARYFRVDAEGLGHVPSTGRALLVANHAGALPWDGAMVMHAVRRDHPARRDVRPLVEDFVYHFPYLGTVLNRIGAVRACQENAERLLANDQLVAVFPEGIKGLGKLYRERYKLQRFGRGGFIKLALRARAPIVPVAIVGAEETHPVLGKVTWFAKSVGIPFVPVTPTFPWLGPLGLVPLPVKWFLRFGAPIDLAAEYGPEAADDRLLVNRLADVVRGEIQTMIDRTLAHRTSVLFG